MCDSNGNYLSCLARLYEQTVTTWQHNTLKKRQFRHTFYGVSADNKIMPIVGTNDTAHSRRVTLSRFDSALRFMGQAKLQESSVCTLLCIWEEGAEVKWHRLWPKSIIVVYPTLTCRTKEILSITVVFPSWTTSMAFSYQLNQLVHSARPSSLIVNELWSVQVINMHAQTLKRLGIQCMTTAMHSQNRYFGHCTHLGGLKVYKHLTLGCTETNPMRVVHTSSVFQSSQKCLQWARYSPWTIPAINSESS